MSTKDTVPSNRRARYRAQRVVEETDAAREKKQEILAAAARLFEEVGYHTASMEDIASEVGARKPTLYHYFGSKNEILYWIHEDFIDLILDKQQTRIDDGASVTALIEGMFIDVLSLMVTHRGHVRTFFEHHRELPEAQRHEINEKRTRYRNMLVTGIRAGVERGELTSVNPEVVTLGLFGMANWAYQWYRPGGPLTPEDVASEFSKVVFRGLLAARDDV